MRLRGGRSSGATWETNVLDVVAPVLVGVDKLKPVPSPVAGREGGRFGCVAHFLS